MTGLGRVEGRLCMIIANDATVKAGAFFPMDGEESASGTAYCAGKPHSDSVSGGFVRCLPATLHPEDVFPDQDDFGRVFQKITR